MAHHSLPMPLLDMWIDGWYVKYTQPARNLKLWWNGEPGVWDTAEYQPIILHVSFQAYGTIINCHSEAWSVCESLLQISASSINNGKQVTLLKTSSQNTPRCQRVAKIMWMSVRGEDRNDGKRKSKLKRWLPLVVEVVGEGGDCVAL